MSEKISIHCFVSGKVQGVWYRASTQDQARTLGLTGWVRNLPDNRVEVFACGEREDLQKFYQWLQLGPPLAKVESVTYEELPWQALQRFSIQ